MYNNYNKNVLQNKTKKIIVGASATATITVISGDLGMAGGTAILAGGGALIGLAGSSATTLTAILSSASSISILEECSKLLTFSKIVLADKLKDYKSINSLKDAVDDICSKLSTELENKNDNKNNKNTKNIKKSIKYLNKCSKALEDIENQK